MENQNLPAKKGKSLKELLVGDQFKSAIAAVLPKHLTPDRFVRVAITATIKTPLLAQCDQHSFFNALMTLSQLGLEPDGRLAHLIPFRNNKRGVVDCTLIVDYKGLVELAMRSGTVANIHADVVCEADLFNYDRGQLLQHKIDFRKPRGEAYAVYALCRFKDGTEKCEVMTRDEVESIRARSRAAQTGPWVTDWNEMAKKTVFKRLSKWLTLSPQFRDALETDDKTEVALAGTTVPMFEVPPPSLPEPVAPVFEERVLEADIDPNPTLLKPREKKVEGPKAQDVLATWWCEEMGRTWDQFQMILEQIGDTSVQELTGFADMHGQTARKYLNSKAGLNAEFQKMFPGEANKQEGELPM